MLGLVDEPVEAALALLEIQRAAKCPLFTGSPLGGKTRLASNNINKEDICFQN